MNDLDSSYLDPKPVVPKKRNKKKDKSKNNRGWPYKNLSRHKNSKGPKEES